MDTLIQKTILKIMKMNNFQGELTNISAKREPLVTDLMEHVLVAIRVDHGSLSYHSVPSQFSRKTKHTCQLNCISVIHHRLLSAVLPFSKSNKL